MRNRQIHFVLSVCTGRARIPFEIRIQRNATALEQFEHNKISNIVQANMCEHGFFEGQRFCEYGCGSLTTRTRQAWGRIDGGTHYIFDALFCGFELVAKISFNHLCKKMAHDVSRVGLLQPVVARDEFCDLFYPNTVLLLKVHRSFRHRYICWFSSF